MGDKIVELNIIIKLFLLMKGGIIYVFKAVKCSFNKEVT